MADAHHDFEQLIQAYTATDYLVTCAQSTVTLGIGEQPSWPEGCKAATASWMIITADNPGSQRFSEEENRCRRHQLQDRLNASALRHWPALARSRTNTSSAQMASNWPDEAGRLVVGANRAQIRQWCQDFGQLAVVFGHGANPARLLIMQDHSRVAALCKSALDLPVWVEWLPAL